MYPWNILVFSLTTRCFGEYFEVSLICILKILKAEILFHIYHETWRLIQTKFCIVPLPAVYRNNCALNWKYTVWYYLNDFTDIRRVSFNTRYDTQKNRLAHEHVCVWSVPINTVCLQMPRRLSTLAVSYRAAVRHSSPTSLNVCIDHSPRNFKGWLKTFPNSLIFIVQKSIQF